MVQDELVEAERGYGAASSSNWSAESMTGSVGIHSSTLSEARRVPPGRRQHLVEHLDLSLRRVEHDLGRAEDRPRRPDR